MAQYFIGIPVPRDIADILEKAQGGLHAGTPERRANFHIWLGDLGDVPDDKIDDVCGALERVALGPFYLSFEGLGTLGGNAPTVLYAELEKAKGLKSLHRLVGREVRETGIQMPHARVDPHIPIARFGEMGQHDLKQIMSFLSRRAALSGGPFPVTEFNLYRVGTEAEPDNEVIKSFVVSL